jgi:hypothetical protein
VYVQAPPPKKGFFSGCGTLLAIGIGVISVGTCLATMGGSKSKTTAAEDSAQPATSVDAAALIKAYKENEVAADQQFKGKRLEVSGVIERVDSDFADEPVIAIGIGGFDNVLAHGLSKDVAAKLKKGERITLVCRGNGEVIGSPQLDRCTVR